MFRYTNLNNPCPICRRTNGKCRSLDAYDKFNSRNLTWVVCQKDTNDNPAYFRVGDCHSGVGAGVYLPVSDRNKDYQGAYRVATFDQAEQNAKRRKSQQSIRSTKQVDCLSDREKDAQYRALAEYFGISDDHKALLSARGFKDIPDGCFTIPAKLKRKIPAAIDSRVPGVQIYNNIKTFYIKENSAALFLPIKNVKGQIVGGQYMPDDKQYGKYKWLYTKDANNRLNTNSENPLPVYNAKQKEGAIIIVEGVLKSALIAELSTATVIGSTGVNWTASKFTLRETLNKLNPDKDRFIYIAPDAGCRSNKQVFKQILALAQQLLKEKYTVRFLNWGQWDLLSDDKQGKDFDDLLVQDLQKLVYPSLLPNNRIPEPLQYRVPNESFEDFTKDRLFGFGFLGSFLSSVGNKISRKITPSKSDRTLSYDRKLAYTKDSLAGQTLEFTNPDDRTKILTLFHRLGFKYVLDSSDCGTGKSHYYAHLQLEDIDLEGTKKIIFVPQPNKPTIEVLKTNHRLPVRSPLNCVESEFFAHLRDNNVYENLCKECKYQKECKVASPGHGTGYLKQRFSLRDYDTFIGHVASLTPSLVRDLKPFVYIDEFSQQVTPLKTTKIGSEAAILSVLPRLHSIDPDSEILPKVTKLIYRLLEVLKLAKDEYHGLDHVSIVKFFADFDWLPEFTMPLNWVQEIYNLSVEHSFMGENCPFWLYEFLEVLSGKQQGSLKISTYRDKDKIAQTYLEINTVNDRLKDVKDCDFVVAGDATLTLALFARSLGLQTDQVVGLKQVVKDVAKVERIQIKGLINSSGFNRSQATQERVLLLRQALAKRHAKQKIGYIDCKSHALEGDLIHLSTARGSNELESVDVLVKIGRPTKNRGAVLAAYQALFGDYTTLDNPSQGFQDYEADLIAAEEYQADHRARPNRRAGEDITIYYVTDDDCSYLPDLQVKHVKDFCFDALSPSDYNQCLVIRAIQYYRQISVAFTQDAIANFVGVSQSCVSRILDRLGGLQKLITALFKTDTSNSKTDFILDYSSSDREQIDFCAETINQTQDSSSVVSNTRIQAIFSLIDNLNTLDLRDLFSRLTFKAKYSLLVELLLLDVSLKDYSQYEIASEFLFWEKQNLFTLKA